MCETRRALRECPGGQQYHKRHFQVRAKRILRTLAKKAHPKADALADSIHKSRSSSVLAAFPFSSLLDAATCTSLVQLCAVASFDDGVRANMTMWNLVNLATAPVSYGNGLAAHNGSAVLGALAAEIGRAMSYVPSESALELGRLKRVVDSAISARRSADSSRAAALLRVSAYFKERLAQTYRVPHLPDTAVSPTLLAVTEIGWMGECCSKYFEWGPEAFRYFKRAADGGNVNAQYEVGECLCTGRGVNTDREEALRYYNLAASQGHPDARIAVGEFEEHESTDASADDGSEAEANQRPYVMFSPGSPGSSDDEDHCREDEQLDSDSESPTRRL